MRNLLATLLFFLIFSLQSFAQIDKRIEEIRQIYKETNEQIADEENAEIFLTELVINKNNGSYPAVGIYNSTVKFFYTYGDREKNPYPNQLLKITITTNRSAMTENYEFLFNSSGQLIFYFEKKDDEEHRFYFSIEKPFRILKGDKSVNINSKEEIEKTKMILAEKKRLVEIFKNSLLD